MMNIIFNVILGCEYLLALICGNCLQIAIDVNETILCFFARRIFFLNKPRNQ